MTYKTKARSCSELDDVPRQDHYVIITQDTYYEYDSYEPMRSVPRKYLNYKAYLDKAEWVTEIESLSLANTSFKAFFVKSATITVKTTVDIQ